MLKKSAGNMYPWVTHTKSYLRGACPHRCTYCYVQAMARRFPNMRARYSGQLGLDIDELVEPLGQGQTIFIEHMNDLFAKNVPSAWIRKVLNACCSYDNTYVFQTKNPERYGEFRDEFPKKCIIGTTIESNRYYPEIMGDAPSPVARYRAMLRANLGMGMFVTIEPILDFDHDKLPSWLVCMSPDFVNIGADSKGTGLPEPSPEQVMLLLSDLDRAGIRIERKTNLERLLK